MKKLIILLAIMLTGLAGFAQGNILSSKLMDVRSGEVMKFNEAIGNDTVTLVVFWDIRDIVGKKIIRVLREKFTGWRKDAVFNFIAVSTDPEKEKGLVDKYASSQHWDFPYYLDHPSASALKALNLQDVPVTLVVDKKGKVDYILKGFKDGDEELIWKKITELDAK